VQHFYPERSRSIYRGANQGNYNCISINLPKAGGLDDRQAGSTAVRFNGGQYHYNFRQKSFPIVIARSEERTTKQSVVILIERC